MSNTRIRRDIPEVVIPRGEYLKFFQGKEIFLTLPANHFLKQGDILLCGAGIILSACEVVGITISTKLGKVNVCVKKATEKL